MKKRYKVKVKKKDNKTSAISFYHAPAVSYDFPDDYDPLELINKIIDNDFDISALSLIDESDFTVAPNFLEFCIGKEYLGYKPWPRQAQIGLEFFADYCPECSDQKLVKNMFDQPLAEILDRVQLLKHGVCPKCHKTRRDFVKKGLLHYYNDLAACAGQRSGKSVLTSAFIATYVLHRYLMIKNPSAYFGLLPNSTLHMTFVALTYNQAYDTLWSPFTEAYDSSPWFQEYNKMLDYYANKYGVPIRLYDYKKTFLYYEHKRLTAYPSGPDKRKLRGRTRIFAATDEIGWFDSWRSSSESVKFNSDEIVAALERSLRTVRSEAAMRRKRGDYNSLDAYLVNISSPSSSNDKIIRLIREANKAKNRIAYHYATWEMNPKISKEDLDDEFRKDPVGAQRDYGAVPTLGDSVWISNPYVVEKLISKRVRNAVKYKVVTKRDKFGNSTQYLKVMFLHNHNRNPHILSIDNGYNNNGFAIVAKYYDFERDKSVTDLICVAYPSATLPINFRYMFKYTIQPIIQEMNVRIVVFDQWQSIDYKQELLDSGIESEIYSLTYDDFREVEKRIYGEKIILPKPEIPFKDIVNPSLSYDEFIEGKPVANFIYQLLSVKRSGRKIIKDDSVGDDIFRAWVLSEAYISDPDVSELLSSPSSSKNQVSSQTLGAVFRRAGTVVPSSGVQPLHGNSSVVGNLGVILRK